MGRVDRNWAKSAGRLFSNGGGVSWWVRFCKAHTIGMAFGVAVPTAHDSQGSSRADILTHPHTTAVCVVVVETVTAGRDSSLELI